MARHSMWVRDMKRSRSRFTFVEAIALIVIMAMIVISSTPKLTARQLTASVCSFPDSRRHTECAGAGVIHPSAKNR